MSARRKSRVEASAALCPQPPATIPHTMAACCPLAPPTAPSQLAAVNSSFQARARAASAHANTIAKLTPRSSPFGSAFFATSRAAACPELRALLHRAVPGDGERAALLLLLPPPPPQVGSDGW